MVWRPPVRKKLLKLAGLHGVDARKHVGEVCTWVDLVALRRGNESQENGNRLTASVRACEQEILSINHEVFDFSLGGVVVDIDGRIFEKASERLPVSERVQDGAHDWMFRVQFLTKRENQGVKLPNEWLRSCSSLSELLRRTPRLDLRFDVVKFVIDVQDRVAALRINHQRFVVLPARMGVTTGLDFGAILVQLVEALCGVGLYDADKLFEECNVPGEGLIGREVESYKPVILIPPVNSQFAFAHLSLVLPVLDLKFAVVRLYYARKEQASSNEIVQRLNSKRGSQNPVTLSGPRYGVFLANEF